MGAAETIFVVQGELESVSHEILPGQRGSMDARIEQINIEHQKHFGIMPIPSARFGEIAPGWGMDAHKTVFPAEKLVKYVEEQ